MDPRDFKTLASALVKPGAAANNRTAIGRAYYAAFNVALDHLRAEGFPIRQNNSAHEEITRHLAWCNDADVKRAGSQIHDLRGKRNKADYHLTDPETDSDTAATFWVAKAQDCSIAILDAAFQGTDKATIVQDIRAKRKAIYGT
jgi:hypothetical protein